MSKPIVLYYAPAGSKKSNKTRALAVRLGAKLINVSDEDINRTITDLIGADEIKEISFGKEPEESVHEKGTIDAESLPSEIKQEMMVFYNFSEDAFDRFLRELKKSHLSVDLKAVVTSTNAAWPFAKLYAEISREREYIKENSSR